MRTIAPIGSVSDARIAESLAAQGIRIERRLTDYAYAKNGNCHNPTPEYRYTVYFNGRPVSGPTRLLRDAKVFAVEYLATPPSER